MVGATRFERATSQSRTARATSCATPRLELIISQKEFSGRPWRWLFPFPNKYDTIVEVRGLAQLVARALWEREVISSSLITPTTSKKSHEGSFFVVYIPGILNALGSL